MGGAFFILLLFALLALLIGSVSLPIEVLWGQGTLQEQTIFQKVRLPRVLLALLVGASLGLAGATFQGVLQNPLADPHLLGVSSGASLGAVIILVTQWQLPLIGSFTLPVVSTITAFITIFVVLQMAYQLDRMMRTETILLMGILIAAFLSATLSILLLFTGDELRQVMVWLFGSVAMRGWQHIQLLLPFLLASSVYLFTHYRTLNAFLFGEEKAYQIGVAVKRKKIGLLIAASSLTGAAVAVSGVIGFVGLLIPHFMRMLIGGNYRYLLPLSMIGGAAFLVLADLLARTLVAPKELPVGIVTAFIGVPFLVILFHQKRRQGN